MIHAWSLVGGSLFSPASALRAPLLFPRSSRTLPSYPGLTLPPVVGSLSAFVPCFSFTLDSSLFAVHRSFFAVRCSLVVRLLFVYRSSLAAHSSVLFSPRASFGLVPAFEPRSISSRSNTAFVANQRLQAHLFRFSPSLARRFRNSRCPADPSKPEAQRQTLLERSHPPNLLRALAPGFVCSSDSSASRCLPEPRKSGTLSVGHGRRATFAFHREEPVRLGESRWPRISGLHRASVWVERR